MFSTFGLKLSKDHFKGFFQQMSNHGYPISIITVRNSSCGKVMFSQVSVYPQGGGVHPPRADTLRLGRHTPAHGQTHPGQTPTSGKTFLPPPPGQTHTHPGQTSPPPGRRPLLRTVRILLECILVSDLYFCSVDLDL